MFAKQSILLVLLLSGCATVHEKQVQDWPALKIVAHQVSQGEVIEFCARDIPAWQKALGVLVFACAAIDFERKECHIVHAEFTPQAALEHEKLHCEGWDHGGILQRGFDYYQLTGKNMPVSTGEKHE